MASKKGKRGPRKLTKRPVTAQIRKSTHRKKKNHFRYVPPPADHAIFNVARPFVGGLDQPLPDAVDFRPLCLPIRNQFIDGPCAGFATAAFRELSLALTTGQRPTSYLAPAFLYALTRKREKSFPGVTDTTVADEFYVLKSYGVCPESYMPYDPNNFAMEPSAASKNAALPYRIFSPSTVNYRTPAGVQVVLAKRQPVVIGFSIHSSFQTTGPDGWVPLPDLNDEPILGGHAMLVCGYNLPDQCWIARGEDTTFGDHGYCYMPFGFERTWHEAYTA